MTRCSLILIAALAAVVLVAAKPQPGKLDTVNVDEVLKNKRLFDNYVKCIMDKAPCSSEGAELKERLPKDLESQCASCSATEKQRAGKVIDFLRKERKDVWEDFKKKYDPESKWGDLEWVGKPNA